jgi:ABC-type multidrug transport system permease subunit
LLYWGYSSDYYLQLAHYSCAGLLPSLFFSPTSSLCRSYFIGSFSYVATIFAIAHLWYSVVLFFLTLVRIRRTFLHLFSVLDCTYFILK